MLPEMMDHIGNSIAPEPHIPVWEDYILQAKQSSVFEVLKKHLIQLRFPIKEGISKTEDYIAAVRRGLVSEQASGLELNYPEKIEMYIYDSIAGKIPIITVKYRPDFVTMLRALAMKNEPEHIPESMGACIISGFNNWDRIHRYKRSWILRNPFHNTDASWHDEFKNLIPQKMLYQDTFILLSNGYYSGISAEDMGFSEMEWNRLSLIIRREHECAHYFKLKAFKILPNSLKDEIIADYMGIIAAMGFFRADWLLRFMGLEAFPKYRKGGRLENYVQNIDSAISELVFKSAKNLEKFYRQFVISEPCQKKLRMLIKLNLLSLQDIASDEKK